MEGKRESEYMYVAHVKPGYMAPATFVLQRRIKIWEENCHSWKQKVYRKETVKTC